MTPFEQKIRKILVKVYAHGYTDCQEGIRLEDINDDHRTLGDTYVNQLLSALREAKEEGHCKAVDPTCACWLDGFETASAEECFNEREEIKELKAELTQKEK